MWSFLKLSVHWSSGFRLTFGEVNLAEGSSFLSVGSLMVQKCWRWHPAGVRYRKGPQDQIIVGHRSPTSFLTQFGLRIGIVRTQEAGQAMKSKQTWDQTRRHPLIENRAERVIVVEGKLGLPSIWKCSVWICLYLISLANMSTKGIIHLLFPSLQPLKNCLETCRSHLPF